MGDEAEGNGPRLLRQKPLIFGIGERPYLKRQSPISRGGCWVYLGEESRGKPTLFEEFNCGSAGDDADLFAVGDAEEVPVQTLLLGRQPDRLGWSQLAALVGHGGYACLSLWGVNQGLLREADRPDEGGGGESVGREESQGMGLDTRRGKVR
jgi:hypothetical protein